MIADTVIWLKQLLPTVDRISSVQQEFHFILLSPGLEVNIDLGDDDYLAISLTAGSVCQAPCLVLADCSTDIKRLAAINQLDKIIRADIADLFYCHDACSFAIAGDNLKAGRKAIVAVRKDGTGFLFIADIFGNFTEPEL